MGNSLKSKHSTKPYTFKHTNIRIKDYHKTANTSASVGATGAQFQEGLEKFGLPSKRDIFTYSSYLIAYDNEKCVPSWTLENLTIGNYIRSSYATKNQIKHNVSTCQKDLRTISHIDDEEFALDKNVKRYQIGFMIRPESYFGNEDDLENCRLFSNIVPILIENVLRFLNVSIIKLAMKHHVYLLSGPIFQKTSEKPNTMEIELMGKISVPTHIFKIILTNTPEGNFMGSLLIPNRATDITNISWKQFAVSIEALEQQGCMELTTLKIKEKKYKNIFTKFFN